MIQNIDPSDQITALRMLGAEEQEDKSSGLLEFK